MNFVIGFFAIIGFGVVFDLIKMSLKHERWLRWPIRCEKCEVKRALHCVIVENPVSYNVYELWLCDHCYEIEEGWNDHSVFAKAETP